MAKTRGVVLPIGYDITDAQKALKELNKESGENFKELKQIEKALKFNPENTELLTQKMKLLGDSVGTSKEKLELLKKAQEEASKNLDTKEGQEEYRKLSREIIETESKMKMYEDRIQSTNKEMDHQKSKLDKLGDGLGKVGDGFKAAGDKMDKVGTGLTKAVTGPIVGVGAAAMVAWKEVDEATDGIIAGTGATGEAADDLIKSFKKVSKEVPADLGDVGTSVANLNTKFGLTGPALEDATTAALKYADVNKVDVGNSINSVAKVMAAADIKSDKFSDTLSKLTAASQDSGVSVDDLTAAYETNGPALRTLGYSFEDSISMIAKWEKAGLNSGDMLKGMQKYIISNDKASQELVKTHDKETAKLADLNQKLEEVKGTKGKTADETKKLKKTEEELTKKIQEQEKVVESSGKAIESSTAASKDGMDALMQSIKDTKDPQEQLNKAIEVFGKKNGPAFVDAIKSGKMNYEEFAKTIEGSGDRLTTTFEAMQDPTDKLKTTLNKLKITGSELGDQMQIAAIPLIEELGKKVEEVAEWFAGLTDEEQQNIIKTGALLAAIGPAIVIMGKLATGVGEVATAAGKAVTGVSKMFQAGGIFSSTGSMAGMAGPIGLGVIALGILATSAYEGQKPQRELNEHIKNTTSQIGKFSDAVDKAQPIIKDFNDTQSKYDGVIADKKSQIAKLEPEITTILSENVKSRTALTDEEMRKLKEYMGLLDSLNTEIAKKYEAQLKVLDSKLKDEQQLNDTAAARYLATINAADAELSRNAEENFTKKMVDLVEMQETEQKLRRSGNKTEADAVKKQYDEAAQLAKDAYAKELAEVNLSTANRIVAVKNKFIATNAEEAANLKKIGEIRKEEAAIEDKYDKQIKEYRETTTDHIKIQNDKVNELLAKKNLELGKTKEKENGLWTKNTEVVGGALMDQVANIILHGGEIDDETKIMVDSFMKTVGKTPESAESFKKAMQKSIQAIVDKEPELAGEAANLVKKFDNTIDDVQTGKVELGKNTVDGLTKGVRSARDRVWEASRYIKETAETGMTANQEKQQELGKDFDRGTAKGIKDNAYLVEQAAKAMARNTRNAFSKQLEIQSPSKVMRKDGKHIPEGVALGILDGASEIEDAMTDLSRIPQEVGWMTDPLVAGDFQRASQSSQTVNTYQTINNINNPIVDSAERVRKLAEELYRLQEQTKRR